MNPARYPHLPRHPPVYDWLAANGWGIIKLPAPGLDASARGDWITATADQIQEYQARGYRVQLIGVQGLRDEGAWESLLQRELRRRGIRVRAWLTFDARELASQQRVRAKLARLTRPLAATASRR